MNEPEIDRCPFCAKWGQEQLKVSVIGGPTGRWHVICHPCGAAGPAADTPEEATRLWNNRPDPQRYALGLIAEEAGEVLQIIGQALRFGLDTPGKEGSSARQMLAVESGDLDAAQTFGELAGLWDSEDAATRAQAKLKRLLDPESRDNLGRRLAPDMGRRAADLLEWIEAQAQ